MRPEQPAWLCAEGSWVDGCGRHSLVEVHRPLRCHPGRGGERRRGQSRRRPHVRGRHGAQQGRAQQGRGRGLLTAPAARLHGDGGLPGEG